MDMSMTMPMSGSPTPTGSMEGMAGMENTMHMSAAGQMMMGMSSMAMTFFTSTSTPLYSQSWTPTTTAQYTGTCIFLVAFAAIFRALLAVRINLVTLLAAYERRHTGAAPYAYSSDIKSTAHRPWRAHEAVILASMDVVVAGTGQ